MSSKALEGKNRLLMDSLVKFFRNGNNIDHMLPIINSDSKISLRIIDWFVTNYAKKKDISYTIKRNGNETEQFIVHSSYKAQLKAYSKKQFDPFCRRERIPFEYKQGGSITTTVGQLNFFRWAIENNVLAYIQKNLSDIDDDMNQSYRNIYNKKNQSKKNNKKGGNGKKDDQEQTTKVRRKRHELSVSATKSISKYDVVITLKFE
jgi:hypothetical protein